MRPRRCHGCQVDVENNHLRMTKCLDGELRLLCEWCAKDEEDDKARAAEQIARKASLTHV
jgi:hypothetical protein